ncbi:MAG: family 20 glycosylhydrolase [Fimbriimonadaceae bacterium]
MHILALTMLLTHQFTGSETPFRNQDRIVFFGDSITWQGGYLDVMSQRLSENVRTKGLQIALLKRGINGGKSNDLRDGNASQAGFAEILRKEKPAAAVIEIGINDVWHGQNGNSPDVYEKCLKDMLASAKAAKVPIVIATPSLIGEKPQGENPLDDKLDQYSTIVKKVGAEMGSIVVDLRAAFFGALQEKKGPLTYDGVHMLPAGNNLLADQFEAGIMKALAGRPKSAAPARPSIGIIPWPKTTSIGTGRVTLKAPSIVALTPELRPLAAILADEISRKTGIKPSLQINPTKDSILLRIAPTGSEESYRMLVDRGVSVTGSTLRGVTYGTATLLQTIQRDGQSLQLPKLTIEDEPARGYRGLLIDVARQFHSIDNLKQCVELCRLYKLNYLQLHLTDDQSFTFPCRAFPLVNDPKTTYSLNELKELVKFAQNRGVAIVPEFDIPGHSGVLVRTYPDLFKIKGTKPYEHHATINFANEEVIKAVETVISEMCEVFTTSPYFHMGGDEADIANADQHKDFFAAFKALGLPEKSQQEIFRRFLIQVNEIVKKRNKQLIVWEGFGRDSNSRFPIPKDILVMEFENAYYAPTELIEDGYSVINASWTPLYVVNRHVWPVQKVYEWDLGRFGRFSNLYGTTAWFRTPDVSKIEGAQICSWEGPEESEIENLRRIVSAMAERVWNPSVVHFAEFEPRLKQTDQLLSLLIQPVLIENGPLDALDPSGFDVPCFTSPLTISLSGRTPIRYTVDRSPVNSKSSLYTGPFTITESTTVRAAAFNASGERVGYESSKIYYHVPPKVPNLATGKKVTVSGGTQGAQGPELAVDDNMDLISSWWATAPQWIQVDLGKVYRVDRIEAFPYWDGSRYYQYTVDISIDGQKWETVADRTANTTPASSSGDQIKLTSRQARFVKVHMLKGSANEGVHLVELRVWEAK